jgi:hypothetical protein
MGNRFDDRHPTVYEPTLFLFLGVCENSGFSWKPFITPVGLHPNSG